MPWTVHGVRKQSARRRLRCWPRRGKRRRLTPRKEIRCQFIILARKDEPTADYARHRITRKDELTLDYAPCLRSQDEIGAQRVALNVSGHNPEMLVAFHWERLVSTLVDMAQSRIAPCSCQRRTWMIVSRCMKAANSPSHSGHKSRCQWLGITAYAQIRIGD